MPLLIVGEVAVVAPLGENTLAMPGLKFTAATFPDGSTVTSEAAANDAKMLAAVAVLTRLL
jgi:hypothetical protein